MNRLVGMKCVMFIAANVAFATLTVAANAQTLSPPNSWLDPATHHTVVQWLTSEPGIAQPSTSTRMRLRQMLRSRWFTRWERTSMSSSLATYQTRQLGRRTDKQPCGRASFGDRLFHAAERPRAICRLDQQWRSPEDCDVAGKCRHLYAECQRKACGRNLCRGKWAGKAKHAPDPDLKPSS